MKFSQLRNAIYLACIRLFRVLYRWLRDEIEPKPRVGIKIVIHGRPKATGIFCQNPADYENSMDPKIHYYYIKISILIIYLV